MGNENRMMKSNHLKYEKQILDLGFKKVKEYAHDDYYTHRYELNCLQVELTYENGRLESRSLVIDEVHIDKVKFNKLRKLAAMLGKENELN